MGTANTSVLNSFPADNRSYHSEPHYENTHLRIRVVCTSCGAEQVGDADDVKRWQCEHQCAGARDAF